MFDTAVPKKSDCPPLPDELARNTKKTDLSEGKLPRPKVGTATFDDPSYPSSTLNHRYMTIFVASRFSHIPHCMFFVCFDDVC
ncbi:hypothetical protein GLAREA_01133 [Glarea lozoyensis ATCC 20868]|uniref:Uncharacterized protein n=1 Tax=Glarea lozoyensis (strain ATCC 20868 / MF5171) TaxID=1116229 RepID=S3DU80_GLAL2|nr:uncharacterized protein GLAREA_01133 [Glarea lozoyensis ATCC 20868]EPE29973.1 hypothetical protein GLAREA_01133 [Glarea lozoyensis ATCC 20868]